MWIAGFADCMLQSIDLPIAIPLERWDVNNPGAYLPTSDDIVQSNMLRFAALAENIDMFDESAFRLSKSEAAAMDPQQRILLEQVASALQVEFFPPTPL